MNTQTKFSEYIKQDLNSNLHHIRVGHSTYIIESKSAWAGSTRQFEIVSIRRIASNGNTYPVSPYECFEKAWLIKSILKELKGHDDQLVRNRQRANAEYYSALRQSGHYRRNRVFRGC